MVQPRETASSLCRHMAGAGRSVIRATAQWTLFFALSFSLTAGVLILAHV